MSDVIDNSIVQMQFDNRQFESGIAQSLNSIQKLKDSLNFSKSLDAFETISRSIKSVSFDPMVTIWQTTLSRITNMAINAGQRITRALTIEPVFTGFNEYTTQIDAVQTILANTEKYGTTLNDVNKALDELNLYADKTIYNFTQMTSNIGRFTAAGVQLDPAVRSIEGMSNLAASSGATAEQASRAYYQMSQALAGMGLRLMDYNSLVNAGMGGQLFQEALKQTARDIKQTTEEYTKLYASGMSVEDISKKFGVSIDNVSKILSERYNADVDDAVKTTGSFRESLSKGWATADILQRTFAKFSSTGMVEYLHMVTGASTLALEELQKIGQQTSFDSKEFNEYAKSIENVTEAQLEEIKANLKQAQTAEDAATKVKTFAQLKDTVKEAVQSGWTQTWEYIIGDFEQAKEFFTRISDYLGNIIGRYSDFRNKIVGDWSRGGGRKAVIEGLWNIVKIVERIVVPLKDAWEKVFPDINVAAVLISVSNAFETLTERLIPHDRIVEKIQTVYEKIFNIFEVLRYSIGDLIHLAPKLEKALSGSIFAGVFHIFENRADAEYRGDTIHYFQKLYDVISDISDLEINVPGMDREGKTKLADYTPYQRLLESISKFWSGAQNADISKLGKNVKDIEQLNDALLKMTFGIEDGNKVISKFSTSKRDDFLRYLQDEYHLEIETAEKVYKLVEKLNKIETDIVHQIELFPMKELLKGPTPMSAQEIFVNAIADIFGTDVNTVLDTWNMAQQKINEGLRKLSFAFNDTIRVLKTLDLLLGALVYMSVSEINEHIVKPIYLFTMKYFAPALGTMYEAIRAYAIPALDAIIASFLILLKLGLEKVFDNLSSWIQKAMPAIEMFGLVLSAFATIISNKFYDALQKLANIDPNSVLSNIKDAITDAISWADNTFKKWAGFSLVDAFLGIIGDIKWAWSKLDGWLKITETFNKIKNKFGQVLSLWSALLKSGVTDVSAYFSALESVFGKVTDSKLFKMMMRLGKVVQGVYMVLSTVSEQFKIFVDNPNNKTLPERIISFVNRVYDAFVSALRLNGVSEKVIRVFNVLFYIFRDFIYAFSDLVAKIRDKLDYGTVGIRAYFSVIFDSLADFVEKHRLAVQSIETAILVLTFATIAVAVIASIINTGYALGEGFMAFARFLRPMRGIHDVYAEIAQTCHDISDMADDISRAFKVAEIISVVTSIVLVAGALYLLSTLDYNKLIETTGVLLIVMGSIGLLTVSIAKLSSNGELRALSIAFLGIAAVIASVVAAVLAINAVWESGGSAGKAIGMVIGLMSALSGLVVVLALIGKIFGGKGLASIVLAGETVSVMAKTMIQMAPAIYLVSKLDDSSYWKAILAMVTIFLGMAVYSWAAGKVDTAKMMSAAILTITLAIAMGILVGALKLFVVLFEDTDIADLLAAMGFIGGVLALIGIVMAVAAAGNWKSFLAGSIALMSIAATMVLIAGAMSLIAFVADKCMAGLIAATIAIAALLGILAAFVGLFALLGVLAEAGVGVVPLVAVAGGLLLIGMTALELGASLVLAGVGAMMFADSLLKLWGIVKEVFSLGTEKVTSDIETVKKSGQSFIDTLKEFFATDLVIIISKILAGINLVIDNVVTILSDIIPTLEKIRTELLPLIDESLKEIFEMLKTYIPKLLTYIGEFLTAVLEAINEFGPPLVEAITTLIKWVFDIVIPWLEENMPGWLEKLTPVLEAIFKFIINGIANLLVILNSRAGDIVNSILGIINTILDALTEVVDETTGQTRLEAIFEKLYLILRKTIVDFIPKLTELALLLIASLTATIIAVVVGLLRIIGAVEDAIVDELILSFPDRMDHASETIQTNKERIISSMENLCDTIADFLLEAIGRVFFKEDGDFVKGLFHSFLGVGLGAILSLGAGLLLKAKVVYDIIKTTIETVLNIIRNKLGIKKDGSERPGEGVHKIGYSLIKALGGGLSAAWHLLFGEDGKVTKLGNTILSSITGVLSFSTFMSIGEDIVNGLIAGISNPVLMESLKGTIFSSFGESGVLAWVRNALKESSPSKATKEMGVFVDKGFEAGLIKGQPDMMRTVDKVYGEGTGVMEGIRDAVGVHSNSEKTEEYAEYVGGGYEEGTEASEPGMLDKVKEVFGNVMNTIKSTLKPSEDGTNPISSILSGIIDGWDPDKGLIENLKNKFSGLVSGENSIFGKNGPFGGILDGLKDKVFGEDGLFGENGLFGGFIKDFEGILQNDSGNSVFEGLYDNVGDIKWLDDDKFSNLDSLDNFGETLSDGKLDTAAVSSANNRTITSNGSYANTMNDMLNSGQYWNDPNALTNADIVNAIATVVQRLDNIDENMPKEVVLDTGAMVGNLSPEMNKALGRMLRQKGRRV